MSRGKQGVFTFVAALATVATMAVAPAFAVTTSGSVAATDERAPEPVATVSAFLGADGVEVSWELSPSDFVRQSPAGSDFTSGGTFANVNDVAGYNVWRADGGLAPELVGSVGPGETFFVDTLPAGTEIIYSVTAADAAGNESAATEALPVSLGPPGVAVITPALTAVDLGDIAIDEVASQSFVIANDATDPDANLSVAATIEGPGYAVSAATLTVTPGQSTTLDVSFAAADVGNLNGDYPGTLTIRTNDPDNRELVVALSAVITQGLAAPDINVTPLTLAFSNLRLINTTGTRQILLENLGGLPLTGSFTVNGAAFSSGSSSTINRSPGTARVIDIAFTPTTAGTFSGSVVFTTDDPDEPEVIVQLTGGAVTELPNQGTVQTTVVKARITFPLDLVDFNDDVAVENFRANFRSQAAATMNVDPSRIINIRIRQGSTIVEFDVAKTKVDASEPTAAEAVASLQTTLADTSTANPITDNIGAVSEVTDLTEEVTLLPEDSLGEPILGWFTRGGSAVGFDDFFLFADNFGLDDTSGSFDPLFDIAPVGSPNGAIDFDDFFRFADDFGKTVANATEIQSALQ